MTYRIATFVSLLLLIVSLSSSYASLPQVKLKDLQTKKWTQIKAAPGKKAIVTVFLSARCPCSNSHLPELKTLAKKYKDFTFIGVHSNKEESFLEAKDYFKKNKLPFPVLEDQNSKVANYFKAFKTPHVFVVAQNGETLYKGGVTNSSDAKRSTVHFLDQALASISNGKEVQTKHGRTLGCIISR